MSASFTPGPWSAGDSRYNRDFRTCLNVMTQDGLRFVAAISCDPQTDRAQLEANASLIAAAPDLYEAAAKARASLAVAVITNSGGLFDDSNVGEHNVIAVLDAALAKVRGANV